MAGVNTLAYYDMATKTAVKSFIVQSHSKSILRQLKDRLGLEETKGNFVRGKD
jgi:hypothetical protein